MNRADVQYLSALHGGWRTGGHPVDCPPALRYQEWWLGWGKVDWPDMYDENIYHPLGYYEYTGDVADGVSMVCNPNRRDWDEWEAL